MKMVLFDSRRKLISLTVVAIIGLYGRGDVASAASLQTESVLVQTAARTRLLPQAIVATSDDGIVVAGGSSVSKETWAVKFDAANRLQWQYTRQAPTAERQAVIDGSPPSSYRGVAEMADGSFFLCAEKPFKRGDPPAGMYLTHLSRDGQFLNERAISSKSLDIGRNFLLGGCVAWANGVAVLAFDMTWPPGPVMGLGQLNYVLLSFGPSGELKWESPVTSFQAGSAPDRDGIVFQETRTSLVISATTNISTELLRFSPSGKIVAHRNIEGRHLLVRKPSDATELQLLGLALRDGRFTHTSTILAEDLTPKSALTSNYPSAFLASSVFENGDGTLLMFGSDINREGSSLRAGIRQIDRALAADRPLITAFGQFKDPFSIVTACLRQNNKAFVYATVAEPRDSGVSGESGSGRGMEGAVVNFTK